MGRSDDGVFTPKRMLTLFICVNMLNYLDRGIIPGAEQEFNAWISGRLGEDVSADTYLGLLQSGFIAGYAIASLVFGHLVTTHPPFKLMGIGLCIWTVAVFGCGLAKSVDSYEFLFVMRVLSGVGEASFQCVAPPFLDDRAPPSKKGLWLAYFFLAIPCGTALGYVYGSAIATSSLRWSWAFVIEGLLMAPMAVLCFFIPLKLKSKGITADSDDPELTEPLTGGNGDEDMVPAEISVMHKLKLILSSSVFNLTTLGYAAYTGVLIGISTFAPSIVLGLGYFDSESTASTTFGGIVALAGVIGTPLGGWLLDHYSSPDDVSNKRATALFQMVMLTVVGTALMMLTVFIPDKVVFLMGLFFGCLLLMATTASTTYVVMASVPTSCRSFAISVQTLGLHAFGDVPSPIIVGAMKDKLAPHCETHAESDDCRDNDQDGLRLTLFITILWMGWTILLWTMSWGIARRTARERRSTLTLAAKLGPEIDVASGIN